MATTLSPGERFINAYNVLDYSLRTQYNFKTSISFTDLIKNCSALNQVIRSYEDDLIDFARLRNVIVHNHTGELIAQPNEEVVAVLEKIARLISTPPLAIDAIKSVKVDTVQSTVALSELIVKTSEVGHNNIPVYKNGVLVGIIRWRTFIEFLGKIISKGQSIDDFVKRTTAEQFLLENPGTVHFSIASAKITTEEVLQTFNKNRKTSAIVITSDGSSSGKLLGIITSSDILDLMKVLEGY